jgi:hypothetical protein
MTASLPQRLLELHARLSKADIDHAFGGAIALAYWTLEPRGTRDIDLNVFLPADRAEMVLDALPSTIPHDTKTVEAIARDGQIRLWWEDTPIDLFFSYEPLHDEAARHRRLVPFDGEEISILGPVELAVFKAMFSRTRDWADIEAMAEAGNLDVDAVRERLVDLVGKNDERLDRLDEALRRAVQAQG